MSSAILITAKGGNVSIKNKHFCLINDKPLVSYPIEAALSSKRKNRVFLSTEDENIRTLALKYGLDIINRPIDLAKPDTNHGDVILHAVQEMKRLIPELNIITILLGNTAMLDGEIIDQTIQVLEEKPEIDSCMTVWRAQDDHPFRAMKINENGLLETFLNIEKIDTNRQSYPSAFFYDQGPWTVRYSTIIENKEKKEGPGPWWWMGKRSFPIERIWITGRDIHSNLDCWCAEKWVIDNPDQK